MLAEMAVLSADVRIPRARLTAVGFVFAAVSAFLLYLVLAALDRPTVAVVWGGLALGTYMAALLCLTSALNYVSLGISAWKIGPWTLLWFGIAFGIATVTWRGPQAGVVNEIALPSVLRALGVVAVGMTAWSAGYCLGPGMPVLSAAARPVARLGRTFGTEVRSPAAPWILYGVGIAARLASVASTGRFGYVGDAASATTMTAGYAGVLGALSLCAPLSIAAASLQVFRENLRSARKTLAVLFLTEVAFGAAAGGKESFVVAVLAIAIPFSAARRRLPKGALIALILTFLVVVIPFNQAYRSVVNHSISRPTVSATVAGAPTILRDVVTGQSALTAIPSSIDYLGHRIREIDNVAIVVQRSPRQIPFLSPAQLIEAPVAGWVPRALWRGKPVLATGLTFSRQFYELPPTTASADTVVGGLYWYGGWIPVLAGMFLLGCGARLLDRVLDARTNPHAIFLILLLFPALVGGEQDWGSILVSIPATLFVWLAAVSLVFRKHRAPGDTVPPRLSRERVLGSESASLKSPDHEAL